ncbi:HEAT repeat domain-containing protein [Nonomuraea sp. NPDC003707]
MLCAPRLGGREAFAAGIGDPDRRVRIEAIRGLVSLDEAALVATAVADPSREVRVWVAKGLGLIGRSTGSLAVLADDADPLVRAAALEASGAAGAPLESRAVKGLEDPDWQVRVGAARCLAAADPATAIEALVAALSDANQDVRKASVLALTPWATTSEAAAGLRTVIDDPDADVRAYTRRALHDLTRS